MEVRRVVAARRAGESVFVADGSASRAHDFVHTPGMRQALVWATEPGQPSAELASDRSEEVASLVPGPGGTRLFVIELPPRAALAGADPEAAAAEALRVSPGMAELFDEEGKHATPTLDYVIVLAGEVWLELDEEEKRLCQGDVVVQVGARHAWSVRTPEPATIAVAMLGVGEEPSA